MLEYDAVKNITSPFLTQRLSSCLNQEVSSDTYVTLGNCASLRHVGEKSASVVHPSRDSLAELPQRNVINFIVFLPTFCLRNVGKRLLTGALSPRSLKVHRWHRPTINIIRGYLLKPWLKS